MPRLSKSNKVKKRVAYLLEKLLRYANYELEICGQLWDKLTIRWLEENSSQPKLIVQTELKFLAELIADNEPTNELKEQIRHDLRLLRDFLGILEDNRAKTQGSANWHFTLKLWHRSTERNLQAFEQAWQWCKSARSQPPNSPQADSDPRSPDNTNGAESVALNTSEPKPIALPNKKTAPSRDPIHPCHNLPVRQHSAFIGSKTFITRLLKLLSFEHPTALISIEGTGGLGKTTLALEAAYRCLLASQAPQDFPETPTFEAIIFTSAQPQFLGSQLAPRLQPERNLRDIFRAILRTLERSSNIPPDLGDLLAFVRESLARQSTLLIVDNLETLEDQQYLSSFLRELPPTVKTILTSRVRSGLGTAMHLDCLPPDEGLELIRHQAQEKDIQLSPSDCRALYQKTGGLPLAIVYAIGQVAVYGIPPEEVPIDLIQPESNLVRYCFEESMQLLRGQPAHQLLMTLSLFPKSASREALTQIALPKSDSAIPMEGLGKLYKLSLVLQPKIKRYSMHSLTREYVSIELQENPSFEQAARNRWLTWYLSFLEPYGDKNWQDWHDYSPLEEEWENLRTVVEWCKDRERYQDFKQLWQTLKGYTQIGGHWHERLSWMDWLIEVSEKREDWATAADAMYQKGRTVSFFAQEEKAREALSLSQRSWQLRYSLDKKSQIDVAINIAVLHLQSQQFEQAHDWLDRVQDLVVQMNGEKNTSIRQQIQILYFKAEIYLKTHRYEQAKCFYLRALKSAESIDWQRMICYIQPEVARIAILQGDLSEAEAVLTPVLPLAERNQDKRCLAICQQYAALLEQARKNFLEAQRWAELAKQGFENLNMLKEARQMADFLQKAKDS